MKKLLLTIFASVFFISIAQAQSNDDKISIFADNCSKVTAGEPKAKSRLRAQDQALFFAISRLEVLQLPKKEFDQYDFNKLIYNLSDNYVNDLKTKTTSQNDQKVCMNISGYIYGKDIISSIIEAKTYSDARKIEKQKEDIIENKYNIPESVFSEINEDIKDIEIEEIDISKDIYLENPINSSQPQNFTASLSYEETKYLENKRREEYIQSIENSQIVPEKDERGLVYIESTKFYNDTKSDKLSKVIEEEFKNNAYVFVTNDKKLANYVIYPNILRVKVDSINDETNRLQMVTMIEMEDIDKKSSTREYQNRFTLFSNNDNEQEIAKDLMEKLILKANSQIMQKIESAERKRRTINTLPSIITPNSSPVIE